ncbi:MAG: universal stress protein [Acidimicrobiales bacterium]
MMRAIVVGYDGSETAHAAVSEAASIARATGADLHILTVVDGATVQPDDGGDDIEERLTRDAHVGLENLAHEPNTFAGVRAHVEVLPGPAAGRLIDRAEELDADLIVVGNRRVQGLDRLLGSVSMSVVRHAPCSVYVAHTA